MTYERRSVKLRRITEDKTQDLIFRNFKFKNKKNNRKKLDNNQIDKTK